MEIAEDVKIAVIGNVNSGKCFAKDTRIMMFDGTTKYVQDIVIGDLLMGDDSTARQVLSTTTGTGQLYDVIPVKGDRYTVNANHILALKTSNWEGVFWHHPRQRWIVRWLSTSKICYKHINTRRDKISKEAAYLEAIAYLENIVLQLEDYLPSGNIINISVENYLHLPQHEKNPYKGYRVGVNFIEKHVDIDPYILGYWLGDGTSSSPEITTADSEVVQLFEQYAESIGCRLNSVGNSKYRYYISSGKHSLGCNMFRNALKDYNLLNNKHIPADYKYNSREVRLNLLAGLVDSDGYYSPGGAFDWVQKSEILFDDVLWLARSLGFAAYKKAITKMCVKPDGTKVPCHCFTMSITGNLNEIPTKIKRKCAKPRSSSKDWLKTGITVKKAGRGEYFGFELDKNQQFLLGDFTVTHNSSLVGTLLRGKNDDGRGSNRELVMNYRHEKETGQTSSVGYQILGFRKDGTIVHVDNKSKKDSWPKIMKETNKLITFMDLAGHEKYLKTTIHGMSSNHPDYALILIEGRGVRGMTREHIMLALSFQVPFVILITKTDLYTKEIVAATTECISKLIKSAKKEAWLVREVIDLEIPLQQPKEKFVPIFHISNVTGDGLNFFKEYLRRLPKRIDYSPLTDEPFEMAVIEGFVVQGIGTVAHGFLARGTARAGDQVWVGPDSTGNYHKTKIRTIQFKRINVDFVLPGHHCTISLPGIDRKLLKQGVYVIHDKVANRMSVRKFTADVKVLTSHPITIKRGYCPILNMDNIRMAARVLKITTVPKENKDPEIQEFLRGGERARVQFKFIYCPAYLRPDATFVFREGKTRGFGKVVSIDLEQADGGVKPIAQKK